MTKGDFLVAEVEVLVAISCPAFNTTAEQTSHLNEFTVLKLALYSEFVNSYKMLRFVLFWWCCMLQEEKGTKYHEKE